MMLAKKIVQLRESANMSQKELAQKLGVSTGTVAEWESEDSIPSLSDISKLSTFFSIPTDMLIKETEAVEAADKISEKNNERTVRKIDVKAKRSFFKRAWFWVTVAATIGAAALTVFFLLNGEVNPKVDANGSPVFIELTDEVYTNADEYLGYYCNVEGKVFQNLGDNGETKGIQVWIDPDNCEQNLMIHYTTDGSFKDGDYVICTGYIKEIHTYTNTYGTELSVPLIYSTDLRKASYIEVMSPTITTITPDELTYEKYGYSITVDKVEFAENETRLYLSAINNGNTIMYVDAGAAVIVQNGKQYSSDPNYDADYAEIPYSLNKGAETSGVIVFPAINNDEFEFAIEIHSRDVEERFDNVTFKISKEASSVVIPVVEPIDVWDFDELLYETNGYSIAIDKVEFYEDKTRIHLVSTNDGASTLHIDADESIVVQSKKQYNTESVHDAAYEELPNSIANNVSMAGAVSFSAVEIAEFEYTITIHADDLDTDFKDVVFVIDADAPYCQTAAEEAKKEEEAASAIVSTPSYPPAVGVYTYSSSSGWDYVLYIYSNGTLYEDSVLRHPNSPNADNKPATLTGTWTQNGYTMCYNIDGSMWNNPFYTTVDYGGIWFLDDYYTRTG